MYKIAIEKNVTKFLKKHKWEKFIELFKEKLVILSNNPYRNNLDIKALVWNENQYRLRIWKYRFLYEIYDDIITISIFNADSKGGTYK
jgi:mRNA interferase RelE/StbE